MSNESVSHTIVPKVNKFPLWILIPAYILILIGFYGFSLYLFSLKDSVPGLSGATDIAIQQLSFQVAGRQIIPVIIFIFALFYKDVRVFQLAWFVAFIRDLGDVLGFTSAKAAFGSIAFILFLMVIEIASFIYLGMIASGKVAKYLPNNAITT